MAENKELSTPAVDAGTRWHDLYDRYFRIFAIVAVVLHAVLIYFVVAPRGAGFEARAEELEVIELPPEIRIPPPPEEIARPATPVIAEEPVEEDITIAETVIEENAPVPEAPPPPAAEPEVGNTFTFTPYTVKPRCTRACDADDVTRHVPALLRRAGVSCTLTVGIRIDTSGNVTATDMLKSSGNPGCDNAAQEWARTTKWTTAMNRDQPVVVWIAQPVTINME